VNLLKGTVDQIDSQTLPAAATLANGVISNAAKLLDGTLTNAEACLGDAITQMDGVADRKIAALAQILAPLLSIATDGLELEGDLGGMPVKLMLRKPTGK
jgi:hypothetical protein